jgi:hypothetical protein
MEAAELYFGHATHAYQRKRPQRTAENNHAPAPDTTSKNPSTATP